MILIKYILKAHIGPFLFSLVTLLFIFLLQYLMRYIEHIAGRGLSWWIIAEFITLPLAWIIVLAVPMSVLVSTLMAFGSLSSLNEITALKASGISIYRIITPVFIVSGLLTYFLIWFNNDVLPDANHRWVTLWRDISRKKPTLTLEPGIFNKDIDGYCILVRKTYEHSNELENVTIFDYQNPTKNVIITARKGNIAFSSDYQKIIVTLYDGQIHETSRADYKQYRKILFSRHRIPIDASQYGFKRSNESTFSRGDRELSSNAMRIVVDSLSKENTETKTELSNAITLQVSSLLACKGIDSTFVLSRPGNFSDLNEYERALEFTRNLNSHVFGSFTKIEANNHRIDSYLVEIYKKYSIPVACLVFVLIGAPLGIMTRKGGFGVGASLSLGFFLLYWSCLIGGEKLADRDITSPFLGMWIANIILTIFGVYLVYKVVKESIVIKWDFLKRFTPKHYRSLEDEVEV